MMSNEEKQNHYGIFRDLQADLFPRTSENERINKILDKNFRVEYKYFILLAELIRVLESKKENGD